MKQKNEPPTQRNTPLFAFFSQQPTFRAVHPIQLWYPGEFCLKTIASLLFFFFFSQTYKQPHPLHRHIFNSVITPQGDETAVQPPAEAASSVRSFLWDSAGVGGVRLHSPTVAGTEGRRGGSCDSPPFVKGRELAVSPRRLSSPSIFALFISPGFQLATMRGLPLSSASNLVNLFPGRPRGWRATWLERTGGEDSRRVSFSCAGERRVIRLHFRIVTKDPLGKRSHIISSEKKEIMSDEMRCLSCRGDESVDKLQQRPSGFELSGSDLPKVCMRKNRQKCNYTFAN